MQSIREIVFQKKKIWKSTYKELALFLLKFSASQK